MKEYILRLKSAGLKKIQCDSMNKTEDGGLVFWNFVTEGMMEVILYVAHDAWETLELIQDE